MAVSQNECYRLITLGYLSGFTNQAGVTVNVSSLAAEKRVNTYCPTYGELTGGTLVPNWKQGTTPNGDTDGIVVSQKWYGDNTNYTSNQCVDQKDLSVKWTRLEAFTIAANPTSISGCSGETSIISYNHKYTRYTKEMNASCASATSSASVEDTTDSEVNISVASADGSIGAWSGTTHTKPFTSKAYSGTGDKTITISGDVTFRSVHHTATAKITQKSGCGPDCGEYKWRVSGDPTSAYSVECGDKYHPSSYIYPATGGTYTASGRGVTEITTVKVYEDDCGHISGSPSSTTVTTYTALPDQSGEFTCVNTKMTNGENVEQYLAFEFSGSSVCECKFTQDGTKEESEVPCSEGICMKTNNNACWFVGDNLRPTCQWIAASGSTVNGDDTVMVTALGYNGEYLSAYTINNLLMVTDWLGIYQDPGNYGRLHYICGAYTEDENPGAPDSQKYREAQFYLTNINHDIVDADGNSPVCEQSLQVVRQVLCGYDVCQNGSGRYYYITAPEGTCPVTYKHYADCPTPPTPTYSFTIKTSPAVQGATVTMGGKTYLTNSAGIAVHTSTSSASVTATISKSGCKFNGSTTASVTVGAGQTVTVATVCDACSTCLDANIRDITTMSPLPSTVGGGVVITFVVNDACSDTSKYALRHISGAVILKSISISYYASQHRMIVSASYDANTFTTSRAENLGITFNGTICKTINIVQKGKTS